MSRGVGFVRGLRRLLAASVFACVIAGSVHAAVSSGGTASTDAPKGVSTQDWSSIRAAYDAGRHAIVLDDDGARVARNPGQQWHTRFDGRGFTVTPDAGGWTWGLELRRVGFAGAETDIGAAAIGKRKNVAEVSHQHGELHYDWSPALREWFVNDARGLQQGWTINERPPQGKRAGALRLELAVRGGLVPRISADARAVSFEAGNGANALNFGGLKAWDAEGKVLAVRFEQAGAAALRIAVDEREARYPITIDPIAQQAYLKASNTGAGDLFGYSVAVSGGTVVVGAPEEDSSASGVNGNQGNNSLPGSGAAYVFVRSGASWSQQAYLKASNPGNNIFLGYSDKFGFSVAVAGDTVVVGAYGEASNATGVNGNQTNNSAPNSGAAYVFVRSGTTWAQQAYLKASNTAFGDSFGLSVATSGDTVVVGAWAEDSNATGVNGNAADNTAFQSGAAYVFAREGVIWTQQAYLKASNTGGSADESDEFGDKFGFSVSVSGNTVVVGANEEASSATGVNGDQGNNDALRAGAAYVFVRTGTTWTQQAYLKASNTGEIDQFGFAVAVSGDTVVVGAYAEDSIATGVNGNQGSDGGIDFNSGAAYVFVRNGAIWSQQAYLKPSNTDFFDYFGWSVAASGDTVVVGAHRESSSAAGVDGNQNDNSANVAGAAYIFLRTGTTWAQQHYLKASNPERADYFSWSVSVSDDTVVAGAHEEDSNATGSNGNQSGNTRLDSGAAYVFGLPSPPVIFIPGISGSTLVDHPLGSADEIWLAFPLASRRVLSLYDVDNPPPPDPNARDIVATDVVRDVEIGKVVVAPIYSTFLETLETAGGYREYGILGLPDRLTTAGCDLTQISADSSLNPNLFVFPYDWRKSNIETATKLKDYVGCVALFHPGREITLLTHSMGGLVARRYVLDNPTDHNVDKMVTVVAPWLGAAKVLNVLETGDFIEHVAAGPDMKYAAPSLPAAAQLLASRAYFDLGGAPMLSEDGWDADGDGQDHEIYEYADVVAFLDSKYQLPPNPFPGSINNAFHSFAMPEGAQDDWSVDTTGVEYFHLYGVQAGNLTISQLVARNRVVCDPLQIAYCRFKDVFDLRFTVGDATVPARSAGRSTSFGNLNAAPADHIFRFAVGFAEQNASVDHTAITENPVVLSKVLELLAEDAAPPAPMSPQAHGSASGKQTAGLPVTDDELQSTIPSYYLTLNGSTPLVVSDAQGNSTVIIANDLRDSVPGVKTYVLGNEVEMLTLPIPVTDGYSTEEYSITFLSDGDPIALDVIKGVDNVTPTEAIRYLDTTLPNGVLAQIQILPAGVGPLRYDSDGDGSFDTVVPPTVTLSGPAALDATAPIVIANQNVQGGTTQITLNATDSGGSGVNSLRYSLDGTQFQPYTGAFSVNPVTTPFVYAFADDNAGNRSSRVTIRVVTQATVVIFQNSFE